ncbi:MAG: sigma-70 family RNA polymerase sigma factor [Phycisphaerales bacterium]
MATLRFDSPHDLDDASALRLYAQKGDPDAFAVLANRYHAMVLATCRRTLRNDADADDAAQETFLRLARQSSRIRSNVAAWLHACAVGASIDLVRRSQARSRAEAGLREQSKPEAAASSDEALWWDLEPMIDAALAELSEADRHLIVARYLAGRPQNELAQDLGVSEGTISRRLSRALARLRSKLAASGLAIAGASALGLALENAAVATVTPVASAAVAKIAIAGVGVQASKVPVALVQTAAIVAIGGGVTIASLILGGGGGSGSTPPIASLPTATATSVAATLAPGPARPKKTIGPFQTISAYDEDFGESGTFITVTGIAIRRGMDPISGKPRRIRLDTQRTRSIQDDPKTRNLREVAEIDVLTARVLPESDEWARFSRGQNLTLSVAFDQFDRLVIREKNGLVQIGKNEPAWYGVRPPPGWDQRDEIPDDAGQFGILGPWTESERIPVTITADEIRLGPESWNAGRYRIISWNQEDGFSRVLSIQAGGRDPRLIGTRFKLLIREVEEGYQIAYYPPSTGRSDRWPPSFEYEDSNPVRLVTLGRDK